MQDILRVIKTDYKVNRTFPTVRSAIDVLEDLGLVETEKRGRLYIREI
jgi:DNA-binding GntR family transcriptional regulator